MLYMVTYEASPENVKAANQRFSETGGPPPSGVKMVGRWSSIQGKGFTLAETDDYIALGKWVNNWSDVFSFEVTPVLLDEEIAQVIKS